MVVQLGLGKYTIIHCTLKVFRLPDQLFLCSLDPIYGIPALILKTLRLELLEKEISARSEGMFLSPQLWKSSSLLGGKLPVWVAPPPRRLASYLDFRQRRRVPGK